MNFALSNFLVVGYSEFIDFLDVNFLFDLLFLLFDLFLLFLFLFSFTILVYYLVLIKPTTKTITNFNSLAAYIINTAYKANITTF